MAQLGGPDSIRALLCAFAARGAKLAVPVSTIAIQGELHRRNSTIRAGEVLAQLADLRDVQRLGGGFWLPTPLHLIECDSMTLAASGLPTGRLERQYGIDLLSFGALRPLRSTSAKVGAPRMSMFEWLGISRDSLAWLDEVVANANWSAPYHFHGFKVFRSWKSRFRARWIDADEVLVTKSGVSLSKAALPDGTPQYVLADIRRGNVERLHELPPASDIPRLMCALRCRDGDATVCTSSTTHKPDELTVDFEILPAAEARFIMAMSRSVTLDNGFVRKASIPLHMAAPTKELMDALGVSTQGTWQ